MLTELCAELKNYFIRKESDKHIGEFTIAGGTVELPFLLKGQYFRIVGSVLNDGVYRYPAYGLKDEVFEGAVWAMAVPPAVVALAADIDEWNTANKNILDSPYSSESFGGYSYTKRSGGNGAEDGGAYTWQSQFADRIRKWRRLHV